MSKQDKQRRSRTEKASERRADRRGSNAELRGVVLEQNQRPNRWEQQAAMQERQRF